MSFLRRKLDDLKKPFEKGQKWEKYAPAINAFDTFLFVPNHTTQTGAHIRDAVDLKRTMVTVIIALLPALIYGIYNTGYQYFIQTGEAFTFLDAFIHGSWKIIPMIIVSYVVGLTIEFIFANIYQFYILVQDIQKQLSAESNMKNKFQFGYPP